MWSVGIGCRLLDFAKTYYFRKFLSKMLTVYIIKERVFDFDCCPSVLNLNIVEWMFKDSLACIRKFFESDDKIQVVWNVGDVVCWVCGMLGLWDIGDVGCWWCAMLVIGIPGMRDDGNVWCWGWGCWGCGMLGKWDVRDVGCSGNGMLIYKMPKFALVCF